MKILKKYINQEGLEAFVVKALVILVLVTILTTLFWKPISMAKKAKNTNTSEALPSKETK